MRLSESEFKELQLRSVLSFQNAKVPAKKKRLKSPVSPSKLESSFLLQIKAAGIPVPKGEHRFHPERRWRMDFVWLEQKVCVELEGGTYSHGQYKDGKKQKSRHLTPTGFYNDARKYNAAQALGWYVVRADSKMVKNGEAVADLVAVLNVRGLKIE